MSSFRIDTPSQTNITPRWNANQLQGIPITTSTPSNDNVLTYDTTSQSLIYTDPETTDIDTLTISLPITPSLALPSPALGGVYANNVRTWNAVAVASRAQYAPQIVWNDTIARFITEDDSSSDGINWATYIQASARPMSGDNFVVCVNGPFISRTTDGITWTSATSPLSNGRHGAYASTLDAMVVVTDTNSQLLVGTNHGRTWTHLSALDGNAFNAVAWAPELSVFCTVGFHQSGLSHDAFQWTFHSNTTTTDTIDDMTWSPDITKFVALASQVAFLSSDGIAWATSATGFNNNVINFYDNMLCASGVDPNEVQFSQDGVFWISSNLIGGNEYWTDMAFSPSLQKFVVVHNDSGEEVFRAVSSPAVGLATQGISHLDTGQFDAGAYMPNFNTFINVTSVVVQTALYSMSGNNVFVNAQVAITAPTEASECSFQMSTPLFSQISGSNIQIAQRTATGFGCQRLASDNGFVVIEGAGNQAGNTTYPCQVIVSFYASTNTDRDLYFSFQYQVRVME